MALAAITELDRRDQGGSLSSKYQQQIIEMGLAAQATTDPGPIATKLIEFVERKYLADQLSQQQKTTFGQQCANLLLRVRPTVIAGDQVPFQIDEKARVTGSPWWVSVADANKIEIDGVIVRQGDNGGGSTTGLGGGSSMGSSVDSPAPGKHEISVSSRVSLHCGPFDSDYSKSVLFQTNQTLTATFEVTAIPSAGFVNTGDDPKLADPIRASIKPEEFAIGAAARNTLSGRIKLTTLPANIAFDIYVSFNGQETKLGSITAIKSATTEWQMSGKISAFNATAQPCTCDLIFRSSEMAARATVDLTSIWNGKIVYPGVPVGIDQSR